MLLLANSIKRSARCVAGREVVEQDGRSRLGGWIRPVSTQDEGELLVKHYTMTDGRVASVLDIVDISLVGRANNPGQPENWLLDEDVAWSRIRTVSGKNLSRLEERPPDLWLEDKAHSDRISAQGQARQTSPRSLVIVRPTNFRVRLWREFNQFKGYVQRKSRAVFTYAGDEYDLSITDPIFSEQYCRQHPEEGKAHVHVTPPCADTCLLCVSLTPPFKGYHYKVLATVLEPR